MDKKRRENITYQEFMNACTALQKDGIRLSVRALHRKLEGGSSTTVSEYLQRWEKEHQFASSMSTDISDGLRQTLLAEIGQAVATTKEKLEQQLVRTQEHLKEIQDLLAESEANVDALKAELQQNTENHQQQVSVLEKQLAAEQGRIAEATNTITSIEKNYQEALKGQELARIEAAQAKFSVERADQSAGKAEERCAELQKELVQLRKESHQFETKAAVAEARVQEIEKQNARFEKEIATVKSKK